MSAPVARLRGKVKSLRSTRQFGFIAADDGKDYFFHQSGVDISLNFGDLHSGDAVLFDLEASPKGPRAINVRARSRVRAVVGSPLFRILVAAPETAA